MSQQNNSFTALYDTLKREWKLERFSVVWPVLAIGSFDHFRNGLLNTQEYAAFFIRALLGDHPSRKEMSRDSVEKKWVLSWTDSKIEILGDDEKNQLNKVKEEDLIGADLTARTALVLAWQICQSTKICFYPEVDICENPQKGIEFSRLRFHSADFIFGNIKDQIFVKKNKDLILEKMESRPQDGTYDGLYYKFDLEEGFKNHGWRTTAEHGFTNDPYDIEKSISGETSSTVDSEPQEKAIETFLGFPSFYQHDALKVIFCCHTDDPYTNLQTSIGPIEIMDPSVNVLLQKGIEPYCRIKQDEYNRINENNEYSGGVVFCLGVAPQRSAHFEPENVKNTYGVFFTIAFVGVPQSTEIDFEKICTDLEEIRYRLQYKILQVLTARLMREAETKKHQLQKYESMYNQLLRPLSSLTEAIRKSQDEVHELMATIYDPLEVLLGRQHEIARFFEDNVPYDGLFNFTLRHAIEDYTLNEQYALGAEVLHSILPYCLTDHGIDNKFAFNTNISKEIFCTCIDWYDDQYGNPAKPYHNVSHTLLCFLGIDSWSSLSNSQITITVFLNSVKSRFFSTYKPEESNDAIQWEIMNDFLRSISYKNNFVKINSGIKKKNFIVPSSVNPFSSKGHLIAFIIRVVAQHVSHHSSNDSEYKPIFNCNLKKNTNTIFTIISNKKWFNDENDINDFNKFLELLQENRKQKLRTTREVGNRRQPFVDLFERIPQPLEPLIMQNGALLTIKITKIAFEFNELEFQIISTDQG